MFLTNVKRILRSGLMNFWRNSFVSLSSILIMSVTLLVIGCVIFTGVTLKASLAELEKKVDINVYFMDTAPESDVLEIKKSLEALPEVLAVEYISREQAIADCKERHKDDQLTLQALEELGKNPLGATLNIKAKEPSQYAGIDKFLSGDSVIYKNGVRVIDETNFNDNKTAIERLNKIMDSARKLGLEAAGVTLTAKGAGFQ